MMGKRSNFERREADFYPTPRAAVVPLIPYLRGIRTFAEPCAGDGALVRHLESFGLRCVYAGDIRSGQDALERDDYGAADVIITNPPWSRDADAQADHAPPEHRADVAAAGRGLGTHEAGSAVPAPCSDIVAIGRVKWIEGSKHTGKDNARGTGSISGTRLAPSFTGAIRAQIRFDSNFEAAHLRAMRQGLRAVAAIQFTVLFASM